MCVTSILTIQWSEMMKLRWLKHAGCRLNDQAGKRDYDTCISCQLKISKFKPNLPWPSCVSLMIQTAAWHISCINVSLTLSVINNNQTVDWWGRTTLIADKKNRGMFLLIYFNLLLYKNPYLSERLVWWNFWVEDVM